MATPVRKGDPVTPIALTRDEERWFEEMVSRLGRTHYEVLGVARGCDVETVRLAHLKASEWLDEARWETRVIGRWRSWLPNLVRAVETAAVVLSDGSRRAHYDELLDTAASAPGTRKTDPPRRCSGEYPRAQYGRPSTLPPPRFPARTSGVRVVEQVDDRALRDPRRE